MNINATISKFKIYSKLKRISRVCWELLKLNVHLMRNYMSFESDMSNNDWWKWSGMVQRKKMIKYSDTHIAKWQHNPDRNGPKCENLIQSFIWNVTEWNSRWYSAPIWVSAHIRNMLAVHKYVHTKETKYPRNVLNNRCSGWPQVIFYDPVDVASFLWTAVAGGLRSNIKPPPSFGAVRRGTSLLRSKFWLK